MNIYKTLIFSLFIGLFSSQLSALQPEPCAIVIFGATGDLTARKLLPALSNLAQGSHLSEHTAIIGFARGAHTDETFRKKMGAAFENKIFYHQADFEQDQGYENLQKLLLKIDQEIGTQGNRLYYLATQPSQFATIIKKLHEHQLLYDSSNEKWSRVIIEKPFGHDLDSAMHLQEEITKYLDESQIYRMDHYLGKEGVQNLFTLRFESALFEPLWNSEHIDNVQITLSEEIGIGTRASFWEETGSLRDVFQNHLMQLLAIVAMEPPSSLSPHDIHTEKIKVLNAVRSFPTVIRGQYGPGEIRGVNVPGYKQEKGVAENSSAETFIAAKFYIDNPRWEGVPFYIRGGKRLPVQTTEIAITFKNHSNVLFIRIQPNAGVFLKTLSKVPALDKDTKPVVFGYHPDEYFKTSSPEAYEKLFYDCISGDSSLYVEGEEQLSAWRLLDPVLKGWKTDEEIPTYEAGTWGPPSVDQMLQKNGHQWQLLDN